MTEPDEPQQIGSVSRIDKEKLTAALKSLADNIFWPAAAGNVFWVLFALWFDKDGGNTPQFVLVLLATFYLCINWLRHHHAIDAGAVGPAFWILDWVHVLAVVITVNVAQYQEAGLAGWLTVQLSVTAFGHWFGFWAVEGDHAEKRNWLCAVNLAGIVAIFTLEDLGVASHWVPACSFGLVLLLWLLLRGKEFLNLFGVRTKKAVSG